jgi:hypothetical protein
MQTHYFSQLWDHRFWKQFSESDHPLYPVRLMMATYLSKFPVKSAFSIFPHESCFKNYQHLALGFLIFSCPLHLLRRIYPRTIYHIPTDECVFEYPYDHLLNFPT